MPITSPLVRCRLLGVLGSALLATGGALSGALPATDPLATVALLADLRRPDGPGLLAASFGLGLLVVAWWWLGRLVTTAGTTTPTHGPLLLTLACWCAPLLAGPPLFSRDVYSYLAQGAMAEAGLEVYRDGPAVLGGPLAAEVPAIWQHTPTPYGPVALLLARVVVRVTGDHVVPGVLAMRLVALLGTAVLAVTLPALARRCGVDPAHAVWLGLLNPLVILHLVGGAHNDAVMLAGLVAGLLAALDRRPVVAAVLVTLAALVKAPAAAGLVFVAPLWAARLTGPLARSRAWLATATVSAATAFGVTALAGTGVGWIGALHTPVSSGNWSPSSTMGRLTRLLLEQIGADVAPHAVTFWRWAGLVAVLGAGSVAWLRRDRLGPVHALGLALGAVVVFGPAIRPWYLLWAVLPLAGSAPERTRRFCAAACAVLAVAVLPDGFAPDLPRAVLVLLGVGLALVTTAALRWAAVPRRVVPLRASTGPVELEVEVA